MKVKIFFLILLAGTIPATLHSHGGEDHGDEESTSAPAPAVVGAPIYLSKESQFLLGVRTTFVVRKELKKRFSTLGQVVPRAQGKADIFSPQSGRIITDKHYRIPQIGDRVKKGQIVVEIQVIDSFHVRAPLSGVITEINFAEGEQVEQGKKLLTIVNTSQLWVEANIFELDLPAVEGARTAFITTATYPDELFKGRRIALVSVLDPTTRSVKAVFTVPNPDGKLRVGMLVTVAIETAQIEDAIAVPASAVLDKDGRRVVYVKTAPELFTMRYVEVGDLYGELMAIKSGLKEDERVVIVGNYQLLSTPPLAASKK